jgi:hypothetical protein
VAATGGGAAADAVDAQLLRRLVDGGEVVPGDYSSFFYLLRHGFALYS